MTEFDDRERAQARAGALRGAQPLRGSRPAQLWEALARYLSGQLEHERRAEEREDRKRNGQGSRDQDQGRDG